MSGLEIILPIYHTVLHMHRTLNYSFKKKFQVYDQNLVQAAKANIINQKDP